MQITIKPSDHAFPCDADETVLQAAMRADLMIPYGCRNGACGTCKGKIIGGDVDYGAYVDSHFDRLLRNASRPEYRQLLVDAASPEPTR